MDSLKNIKCFLLDLDGTIYVGNNLIDGAVDFLKKIKAENKSYCFLTNNSSLSTKDYIKKLSAKGIKATEKEVLTSGYSAICYLKNNYPDKKVYLFGTESLKKEFLEANIILTEENPDIVLISYNTEMTYKNLSKACKYIKNGALYMVTHPDINCPGEDGDLPDVGSFVALIEKSTGKKPQVNCGKPGEVMAFAVSQRFDLNKNEIAMVGDRLYTDIMFAINNGFLSVLTLSGETDEKLLNTSNIKPDYVINSVKSLIDKISNINT